MTQKATETHLKIHYAREARPGVMYSVTVCPRCTNRNGVYLVTNNRQAVTCKRCVQYLRATPPPAATRRVSC